MNYTDFNLLMELEGRGSFAEMDNNAADIAEQDQTTLSTK